MLSGVALVDDSKDAAESIDQEIVSMMTLNEFQEGFRHLLQDAIVAGFKRLLLAFGGMEDDSHRLGVPWFDVLLGAVNRE
jgi:hypothetical protein